MLNRNGGFVITDHRIVQEDIRIPATKLGGATDRQKVVVRLTGWKRHSPYPYGEVIEILGNAGENETEMHAILAEYGLPYNYPEELEQEANKIDADITDREIKRRLDIRDITTFTIDPDDAKDFDDALSIRETEDGMIEVGVHIADVTHYVHPDTPINKEAYSRATSVYLVDRTIPMLPEHLSNFICSLRPNEDKLCYSVIFSLNQYAEVQSYKIKHTVIRSNRRFTYEEAQQRIESGEGDLASELRQLNDLAKQLRKKRFEKGAINFEREEVKFRLDEHSKPVSVYFKEPKEANNLIEEFMLLANKTVAQHISKILPDAGKKGDIFVYRVHDVPDPDKLKSLSKFIKRFGYNLKQSTRKETTSKNLNRLLNDVKGKTEQNLIETLTIRSMAKAVYSTENIGHYGLAFSHYTHFTSPIRRYPDMMVHRLLDKALNGKLNITAGLEERAKHCSDREQQAANAERSSIKYKQIEFLNDKIGEQYDGIISGVTDWGIYVELIENKCEGMIPLRELSYQINDYFLFKEEEYVVEGVRTGKTFRLGDKVRVEVETADLIKRRLDFKLIEND